MELFASTEPSDVVVVEPRSQARCSAALAASEHHTRPCPEFARRALSLPPLVWIGVRSYGLYLWHYPIFRMFEPLRPDLGTAAYDVLVVAVSFAATAVSYVVIEQPFLARKASLRRREPALSGT